MNELSQQHRKTLASLSTAKGRKATGLYLVEGIRAVTELISAMPDAIKEIIATNAWWEEHVEFKAPQDATCFSAKRIDIERISSLSTPQPVMATFAIPAIDMPSGEILSNQLTVALDGVQDPGNLGTIIRLCDWWGVKHILCSFNTADSFSPKVVQASMGALGRVSVHKVDLATTLSRLACSGIPVCGTFMNGDNILQSTLPYPGAILVLGNEGNGISPEIEAIVTRRLTIPSYTPAGETHVESLNVGTAAAICLAMFRKDLPLP